MTSDRRPPVTAAELMAQLDRDPAFVDGQLRDLAQEEANRRQYQDAAEPLLAELAEAGFAVQTVGQLRRVGVRYPAAVPVLARWMGRVDYLPLWEDIVRSLAVPWAVEAAPALLAEFRAGDPAQDPPDTSPRWVVGLALGAIADPSLADELIDLAADPRWGAARGPIVRELAKTGDPRAAALLVTLLDDPAVSVDAVVGLGNLADPATRSAVEPFLAHPDSYVRNEAKKAARKIDRKEARGSG
jgi:HEAT repeat protein